MATTLFARDLVRTFRKNAPDMSPHVLPANLANVYRPGVQLNNLAFENPRYRKMHIETEHIGMMQSVHSTIYPRPQYDAPILTLDLVTIGHTVTYALLDACPVATNLTLPLEYGDAFRDIQTRYGLQPAKRHTLPDYGRSIFSRQCFLEKKGIDPTLFTRFALECIAMHMEYCTMLDVSKEHRHNKNSHHRFSRQQRQNEKKRAVLSTALGNMVLTDAYLQMLFE